MSCYCDYEPATAYVKSWHRARKQHKCYECHRAINAGEQYEKVWAVWDGSVGVVKTCTRCLDLREYIEAHVPCFCIGHGNVNEDAIETAIAYKHEAPGLLFGAYRRLVKINRNNRVGASK
jgi:hypothetical protein